MGINDVTRAFTGWTETISGLRTSGTYVNGRWVDATPVDLDFEGVIQNATPRDLENLPEGTRSHETIKIHTLFDLIPMEEGTTKGDIVYYEGEDYLVISVAYRRIGNYNKVIAVKQS